MENFLGMSKKSQFASAIILLFVINLLIHYLVQACLGVFGLAKYAGYISMFVVSVLIVIGVNNYTEVICSIINQCIDGVVIKKMDTAQWLRLPRIRSVVERISLLRSQIDGYQSKLKDSVVTLLVDLDNAATNLQEANRAEEQIAIAIGSIAQFSMSQANQVRLVNEEIKEISIAISAISQGALEQVSHLVGASEIILGNDTNVSAMHEDTVNGKEKLTIVNNNVKDMVRAIDQIAKDAGSAADTSIKTSEIAQEGESIVSKSVDKMEIIKVNVIGASEKINELGRTSSRIGEIVEIIDEIAAQTNLLALNAAIEAARAGDHGRGFAVVADEVRKLAERSGSATKEISSLVKLIQNGTVAAVQSMESGTKEVYLGSELAKDTKVALESIIEAVGETVMQIQTISAAVEELAASSTEIISVMGDLQTVMNKSSEVSDSLSDTSQKVVEAMINIQVIAQRNETDSENMKKLYTEIVKKIELMDNNFQDISSTVEEVSAASEETLSSITTVTSQTVDLTTVCVDIMSKFDTF